MAQIPGNVIEQTLHEFVSAAEIRAQALQIGVVRRLRKVDAYPLVLTLILSVATRGGRTIAGLRRAFALQAGVLLCRSSFAARLCSALDELLGWLLDNIIEKCRKNALPVHKAVGGYRDIIAVDSSVAKVADTLRSIWNGTRENSAAAALKVHTFNRALTGELLRFRLTAELLRDLLASTWTPVEKDMSWRRLLDDPNPGRAVLRQIVSQGDGEQLQRWFFA